MQAKLDKQTGGAGGSEKKLDDTDNLVIEILGKDSPVIKGFGVSDSMGMKRTLQDDYCLASDPSTSDVNVDEIENNLENEFSNNTPIITPLSKPKLPSDSQRSMKGTQLAHFMLNVFFLFTSYKYLGGIEDLSP